MRGIAWLMTIVVLAMATATYGQSATVGANGTPTVVAAEVSANCPISTPNNRRPPGHVANNGDFGNEALWTNLAMWGSTPGIVDVPNDGRIDPDGTINEMKWAWYRFVEGKLTVEGRRLDAPDDPLIAWIPDGYGESGFQVSGLTFPSAGCWEITGTVNEVDLRFVVLVVLPPNWKPTATPAVTIPHFHGF